MKEVANGLVRGKEQKLKKCSECFSDKNFRTNEELQATLIAWFEIGQ